VVSSTSCIPDSLFWIDRPMFNSGPVSRNFYARLTPQQRIRAPEDKPKTCLTYQYCYYKPCYPRSSIVWKRATPCSQLLRSCSPVHCRRAGYQAILSPCRTPPIPMPRLVLVLQLLLILMDFLKRPVSTYSNIPLCPERDPPITQEDSASLVAAVEGAS